MDTGAGFSVEVTIVGPPDGVNAVFTASLSASANRDVIVNVLVPALAPGDYDVTAEVDSNNDIAESDETNNILTAVDGITVGADLTVDFFTGSTGSGVGSVETYSVTVTNLNATAIPATDPFIVLINIDGTTGSGSTTFSNGLGGFSSTVVDVDVTIPNAAKATFDITATADSGLAINETDETNNSLTQTGFITITEPPQIEITSPADNAAVIPGTTIAISTIVLDPDGLIAQVEFFINGSTIGTVTTFPFEFDFLIPSPGTLLLTAEATDDDGASTTSDVVTLLSTAGDPPTVSIISPTEGESFIPGFDLDIRADANDPDGLISEVEFFANGVSLGTATIFPFSNTFTIPTPGVYTLTATARDNARNAGFSEAVSITASVGSVPVISISSPSSGNIFIPGAELILNASANDPDGLITQVEFFVNDASVGTASAAPFQVNFSLPSSGVYFFKAEATDNAGNVTISSSVVVTAGPPDNSSPRVILDHPLPIGGGDTVNDVSVASSMFLNATAVDPDGFITEVRFYANNQLLGSTNQGYGDQYSLFFDPTQQGDFEFTAEAVDNFGNIGQALPIPLDVGPLESLLPTGFMRPLSDQETTISVGQKADIQVELNSGLLEITQVNFYANGVFLGTQDTGIPVETGAAGNVSVFNFTWFPLFEGTYAMQARSVQINPNGFTFDNWFFTDPITLIVTEASSNLDFVGRSFDDFIGQDVLPNEESLLLASLDSGQITQSQVITEIFETQESGIIQQALMTRFLLTGQWPSRDLLFQDTQVINGSGLGQLVDFLVPTFQTTFFNNEEVPDEFSSVAEINTFFNIIFENKYGVAPNADQAATGLIRIQFSGAELFLERFITDNDVTSFGNSTRTNVLGIPDPPSDRLREFVDASSLQINLLRITPSTTDVSSLAAVSTFISQIDMTLADSRYTSRFFVPSAAAAAAEAATVAEDIVHPNGNVYDQVLMSTEKVTVQADPGQITRVSFLDENDDIVMAEFSGSGALEVSIDPVTFQNAAPPVKYNQPDVSYAKGRARFKITDAKSDTWFSVFSLGSLNVVNASLLKDGETYDGIANVASLEIINSEEMGGILAGNAVFSDNKLNVGISAGNVRVLNRVIIGDIDAKETAFPVLSFDPGSQFGQLIVAGGDLVQTNETAINLNSNSVGPGFSSIITQANFRSNGSPMLAATIDAQFSVANQPIIIAVE